MDTDERLPAPRYIVTCAIVTRDALMVWAGRELCAGIQRLSAGVELPTRALACLRLRCAVCAGVALSARASRCLCRYCVCCVFVGMLACGLRCLCVRCPACARVCSCCAACAAACACFSLPTRTFQCRASVAPHVQKLRCLRVRCATVALFAHALCCMRVLCVLRCLSVCYAACAYVALPARALCYLRNRWAVYACAVLLGRALRIFHASNARLFVRA